MRFLLSFILFVVASSTLGCTTILLDGPHPQVLRAFGYTKVFLDKDLPSVVTTRGIGLVFGSTSTTIGMLNEVIVAVPDTQKCRIFVINNNATEVNNIRSIILKDREFVDKICVYDQEGNAWPL